MQCVPHTLISPSRPERAEIPIKRLPRVKPSDRPGKYARISLFQNTLERRDPCELRQHSLQLQKATQISLGIPKAWAAEIHHARLSPTASSSSNSPFSLSTYSHSSSALGAASCKRKHPTTSSLQSEIAASGLQMLTPSQTSSRHPR